MTAEPLPAETETSPAGEPLMAAPTPWGTAQLGAPPPPAAPPVAWPHASDAGMAPAPPRQAPHHAPDTNSRVSHDAAAPALPARHPAAPQAEEAFPAQGTAPTATPPVASTAVASDADDEAVQELLRIAVVSRPLVDIAELVTRLEQTPHGALTAASVMRLAAVARPVDDVNQLVALLGPPEHPADHMDEAIRHAAQQRPVPEVTRLVRLLAQSPHDPRPGTQAVHAAATSRSVEDLLHLIASLGQNKHGGGAPMVDVAPTPPPVEPAPPAPEAAGVATADKERQDAAPHGPVRRVAGALMLLCAAVHLPMAWSHMSALSIFAAIGVSLICAAAGLGLCLRSSFSPAVTGTLVGGALTVGYLLDDQLDSGVLAQVLRPGGIPAPLPALTAVIAGLAALTVVALMVTGPRTSATGRSAEAHA